MIIRDVDLIPEGGNYKVDSAGRIIVPAYMRNKFQIEVGDYMEYYTTYVDGKWFLCVTLNKEVSQLQNPRRNGKLAETGK